MSNPNTWDNNVRRVGLIGATTFTWVPPSVASELPRYKDLGDCSWGVTSTNNTMAQTPSNMPGKHVCPADTGDNSFSQAALSPIVLTATVYSLKTFKLQLSDICQITQHIPSSSGLL
ncbi:hypothetical protein Tco_1477644, partial [Tanacetum coccineum]